MLNYLIQVTNLGNLDQLLYFIKWPKRIIGCCKENRPSICGLSSLSLVTGTYFPISQREKVNSN